MGDIPEIKLCKHEAKLIDGAIVCAHCGKKFADDLIVAVLNVYFALLHETETEIIFGTDEHEPVDIIEASGKVEE